MNNKLNSGTLFLFAAAMLAFACSTKEPMLQSPDKAITVTFESDPEGQLFYAVSRNGQVVLERSHLGVIREDQDFTSGLSVSFDATDQVSETYVMHTGKRQQCTYEANRQIIHAKNKSDQPIDIIFQVSNDGVAFRYHFPEASTDVKKISEEISTFNFPAEAKAWLQPMAEAKSGWNQTNPSYEEIYEKGIPVGQPAPTEAGWIYPALFNVNDTWVLITESALDRNYCGTRLSAKSEAGEYKVAFPDPREVFTNTNGHAFPESTLPWTTPWRVIAIGSLGTIVESTLGTDLANPPKAFDASTIAPGISSWSWVLLKDDSTVFDVQKKFIDYAADMNWKYTLIDADWDQRIGYEKAKELADYAKTKDVSIILWYNSAGSWNTVPYTPKDKLLTPESRKEEFSKLQAMGVKGMKIDFFGGDGQSMINYYIDIMEDAQPYGLHLNFHGATLPRGWSRTYPHLMTMESVRGMEFVTFEQRNADEEPAHATIIPFTRNAFDPMDFTPMALHEIPRIQRRTTSAFELASAVVFLSGIQHMAETPAGMKHMPDFVVDFLKRLPAQWDDVKFIDGYPGKLVVLARKAGNRWIVAGMNGEPVEKSLTLDLSFVTGSGKMMTDSKELQFVQSEVTAGSGVPVVLQPNGGFVMEFGE